MQKLTIFTLVILLCFACTKNKTESAVKKPEDAVKKVENVVLPANLFTKEKPKNAISVVAARKLNVGNKVKVFGSVMGSKTPFAHKRASFIIGDPSKISVCEDKCDHPWDSCCDDKKTIAASTLSIQVVDKKGLVLKTSIKGQSGLKELSKVVIEGKVNARSTANFMVINASKIYVE